MKTLTTIKSHLPAISFELGGKYWLACGAQWIEVDHVYTQEELKKAWINERPSYMPPIPTTKQKTESYRVAGSKGKSYIVKNKSGVWSCNCPASTFRRWEECKHITAIKTKQK